MDNQTALLDPPTSAQVAPAHLGVATTWFDLLTEEPKAAAPAAESQTGIVTSPEMHRDRTVAAATRIQTALAGGATLDWRELNALCNEAYGGTQGQGAYTVQDAYETLQVGINRLVVARGATTTEARMALAWLMELEERLPMQTRRTDEQVEYQQFSTPPAYAWVANWVANLHPGEVYLEPQIGTGCLAAFGLAAGAHVVGNELCARRAELARTLGITVIRENADHLYAIYGKRGLPLPTVVVMNPPFSATAGRTDRRDLLTGARQVEEAFNLLRPGGRLVAIVGEGMAFGTPTYTTWWKNIAEKANVRANAPVDGSVFRRFGTNFGTRLLVLDKPGFLESASGISAEVVTAADRVPETDLGILTDRLLTVRQSRSAPVAMPTARKPSPTAAGQTHGPVTTGRLNPQAFAPTPAPTREREEARKPIVVQVATTAAKLNEQGLANEAGAYTRYQPSIVIAGAQAHAAELVESTAMASVPAPVTTYRPHFPAEVIAKGLVSDAQLEQIIRAGQAHQDLLPSGVRAGYFVGDGTGVGKGRIVAGVILDNWLQGRRKAVWISKNTKLAKDALRDWNDIHGPEDVLFDVSKVKSGGSIDHREGIAFLSYDTLKTRSAVAGTDEEPIYTGRLRQLITWLGKDYDGVIAFDESHQMGNAIELKGKRGKTKPSSRALIGIALQKALPKARVLYVSATGATEVANLTYASRLGLWGIGTAFPDVKSFIGQIAGSGIAAMEVVARDIKALGRYLARSIAFTGVGYDRITHVLTEDQIMVYDRLAEAWQCVLRNLNEAMEITGAGRSGNAKSAAMAQFWGTQQRFFNQIMTGMQMPSVLRQIEADIAAGHAVVIQIVNTNAAAQERALAEHLAAQADRPARKDGPEGSEDDEDDLLDLDTTPREALMRYLRTSFPVAKFEERQDEEGNTTWVMVTDSEGNPVEDPDAVQIRDQLIADLQNIRAPDGPLDQILNAFGVDQVAEVTGRSRRVVLVRKDDGGFTAKLENRSDAKAIKEAQEFQDDQRRILIFSDAGGTGQSYHASLGARNQRLRRHYVLQPGWRADAALQGLGRTHRTNQKQPPEFILVSTNLNAQKRFISSIARRLDQLGALTKGQRQTGSGGLFNAEDNLESGIAQDSLNRLMHELRHGHDVGFSAVDFENQTGLKLWKEQADGTRIATDISIPQFLNRLLSLSTAMQDKVFDAFDQRLKQTIAWAKKMGTLDLGVERLKADGIRIVREQVVNTDPRSGAKTSYLSLEVKHRLKPITWDRAHELGRSESGVAPTYYQNIRSGSVFVVYQLKPRLDLESGRFEEAYQAISLTGSRHLESKDLRNRNLQTVDQDYAKTLWEENLAKAPEFRTRQEHWIVGALLPVWDRLPNDCARVYRTVTDDGRALLGRSIRPVDLPKVLASLGAGGEEAFTVETAHTALRQGQTLSLSNGWRLRFVTNGGEKRLELLGRRDDPYELKPFDPEFSKIGVFKEIIAFRPRYFVPTEEGLCLETLKQLTAYRPFVRPASTQINTYTVDDDTSSEVA